MNIEKPRRRLRMTRSKLTTALFAVVLPALALTADDSKPGPRSSSATPGISATEAGLKVKIKPKITLPGAISVPGDKKTFTATVDVGNTPKAGLDVQFSIDGHGAIGHDATNAQGKASVSFTVPNNFKAQIYTVKA